MHAISVSWIDPPTIRGCGKHSRLVGRTFGRRAVGLGIAATSLAATGALAFDGQVAWAERYPTQILVQTASTMQDDGKTLLVATINAAGGTCFFQESTLISRVQSDGALDPQFGNPATPGRTVLSGSCGERWSMAAITTSVDGRIVLAGTRTRASGTSHAIVARLLPNGSPDATFGVAGIAEFERTPSQQPRDGATALAVERQPPFRIFVGGVFENLMPPARAVMFYAVESNGSHAAWGSNVDPNGRRLQIEPFSRPFYTCTAAPLALDTAAGGLHVLAAVVAYCSQPNVPLSSTPFLLRMGRTESTTAAVRATVTFAAAPAPDTDGYLPNGYQIFALNLKPEAGAGRVWIAADIDTGATPAVVRTGLAAFTSQGLPDTRVLNGQGRALYAPPEFYAASLAVQADGKVAVGGSSPDGRVLAAFRVLPTSGAIDPGFGASGSGLAIYQLDDPPMQALASVRDVHAYPASNDIVLTGPYQSPFRSQIAIRMRSFTDLISRDGFEPRP
jgi:uncharacterized delta-60 repeat protein